MTPHTHALPNGTRAYCTERACSCEIRCCRCRRTPDEIPGLVVWAAAQGYTAIDFVRAEEGTYNADLGLFACDDCYIAMGQPAGKTRWIADRYYDRSEVPGSGPAAPIGSQLRAFQDAVLGPLPRL